MVEKALVGDRGTFDEEEIVKKRFSGKGEFSGEAKFCFGEVLSKKDI